MTPALIVSLALAQACDSNCAIGEAPELPGNVIVELRDRDTPDDVCTYKLIGTYKLTSYYVEAGSYVNLGVDGWVAGVTAPRYSNKRPVLLPPHPEKRK